MLTDGSTDRLITERIDGQIILVWILSLVSCTDCCICIRIGGHLRNVNDAE